MNGEQFFTTFASAELKELVTEPMVDDALCLTRIERKKGKGKGSMIFTMTMQKPNATDGERDVLVAKRQRHGKAISYIIVTDAKEIHKDTPNHIGKLKANVKASKFAIYDDGNKKRSQRQEIGSLVYTAKSWSNPRGLMTKIPPTSKDSRTRDHTFVNALPEWDPINKVQCAFFDRNLHARMPLVHTPARLKRACVWPTAFISGVHYSYR
jgi:hypothetical protein